MSSSSKYNGIFFFNFYYYIHTHTTTPPHQTHNIISYLWHRTLPNKCMIKWCYTLFVHFQTTFSWNISARIEINTINKKIIFSFNIYYVNMYILCTYVIRIRIFICLMITYICTRYAKYGGIIKLYFTSLNIGILLTKV